MKQLSFRGEPIYRDDVGIPRNRLRQLTMGLPRFARSDSTKLGIATPFDSAPFGSEPLRVEDRARNDGHTRIN